MRTKKNFSQNFDRLSKIAALDTKIGVLAPK